MYNKSVKFTDTNLYGCGDDDDVYTVPEFIACCSCRAFVDYDGFGHPVKDNMADPSIYIKPSMLNEIPVDATHIVWYNR